MDIRTEIKRCREQTGLTRRAASISLGFDDSYFQKVELGKIEPSLAALRKMGVFFQEKGCQFSPHLEALLGLTHTAA
jgi:predicted transcriptional regulator